MTPLQEDERHAMTGEPAAVIRVVSALRQYRALVQKLIDSADVAYTASTLLEDVALIEGDEGPSSQRQSDPK